MQRALATASVLALSLFASACRREAAPEAPAELPETTETTTVAPPTPSGQPRARGPVRLREQGPRPRPLDQPIPLAPAPQACLVVPSGPPLAALYRRMEPNQPPEAFVYFRTRDGVAGRHSDERIEAFVRTDDGTVTRRILDPQHLEQPASEPERSSQSWPQVRTPLSVDELTDVAPSAMGLLPRRCAEVQVYRGQLRGEPATLHHIPGLDLPETLEYEVEAGPAQLVLMGFLNPGPYVELAARLRTDGESPSP